MFQGFECGRPLNLKSQRKIFPGTEGGRSGPLACHLV